MITPVNLPLLMVKNFHKCILWKKGERERRVHFRVFISSSLQNTFQLQISPYFIVTNFPPKKGNRWFSCTFSCKHTGIMYQCCCQRFNTSWGVANVCSSEEDWAQRNVLLTKKTTNKKKKIHLEITRIPVWKKKEAWTRNQISQEDEVQRSVALR